MANYPTANPGSPARLAELKNEYAILLHKVKQAKIKGGFQEAFKIGNKAIAVGYEIINELEA